ncbi:AAA family ATPase [Amnibacterium sp. CER49]|uniref:MinD/ParA family ATP-binding protein n=1 Tax=Amnibacterium sp. CER49 TaxID=3039161 RepID=UPI0024476638|nr:MinD/ParA family protein [Amnibacterium sp. CER49]MDH2444723.1 AAA family ATPase [Amnibacterium sp. CER49]
MTPVKGAEAVANKRKKPDLPAGHGDASRHDEPLQVSLVTRAAGDEVGVASAAVPDVASAAPEHEDVRPARATHTGTLVRPGLTRLLEERARLAEHPSIEVELPPLPRSEMPEDEARVRIDDSTIDPGGLAPAGTASISLLASTGDVPAIEAAPEPWRPSGDRVTGPQAFSTGAIARTTGPVPRTTGGLPRTTGGMPAVPRRTGAAYDALLGGARVSPHGPLGGHLPGATGEVPRLDGAGTATRRERRAGTPAGEPESAAMLTPDRLIEGGGRPRQAPTGTWNRFVYAATFKKLNLGDSAIERIRKEQAGRIAKQFEGGTRFVPVLTRKGGVGKTTVTTLLGMTLATLREDRIIAVDANPDRGTLSERVPKQTRATVRDVVTRASAITGFTDFSTLVSRDETRLDILASDTDPLLSEAFDENDYNVVADLAARYYSIVLTDCGTGIVHSVMRATLQRADSVVIVSGGSVDEARLASETLTWLEANGYGDLVRNAVVAINTATHGTSLVKLDEIETHFASRVRAIVRIPYDAQLAAGSVVSYKDLKQTTKDASRELAALVVDGLPARREVEV